MYVYNSVAVRFEKGHCFIYPPETDWHAAFDVLVQNAASPKDFYGKSDDIDARYV
jgi:hypothetical protein